VLVRLSWAPGGGAPTAHEVRRSVYLDGALAQAPTVVARVPGGATSAEVLADRLDAAGSYAVWEVSATDDTTRSAWVPALVEVPAVQGLTSWDATQLLRLAGAPPAYQPLTVAGYTAAEGTVWGQSPRSGVVAPGSPVVLGVWSSSACGANCGQPAPGNPARA
jgi:hypothetical protein